MTETVGYNLFLVNGLAVVVKEFDGKFFSFLDIGIIRFFVVVQSLDINGLSRAVNASVCNNVKFTAFLNIGS